MSYPPPPYPPQPVPERMPGMTTAAVVFLWIQFGFGACGTLALGGSVLMMQVGNLAGPGGISILFFLYVLQGIVWTVLRGVFAVKIKRRSGRARTAAVVLEAVGLALMVASWVLSAAMPGAMMGAMPYGSDMEVTTSAEASGMIGGVVGGLIGVAMSILTMAFLSTPDSRRWCNR
ncbi:hypothetical protein [Glycomyces xiaoerkulensis]|uniref:hypothetical protein n=1 Tax=Glycomyces xiaoerkulensis TaxID=2038139 RepID=UPI0012FFF068|nr:hypothetical protein [Glycomyces xiaoerkulensis]